MFKKTLEKKTITICTDNKGNEIRAFKFVGESTKVVTFNIAVRCRADGEFTNFTEVRKSDLVRNAKALDFLYDMDFEFEEKILEAVKEFLLTNSANIPSVIENDVTRFAEGFKLLCNYAKSINEKDCVWVDNGYCNMEPSVFNTFIKDNFDGYKPLQVKKMLRLYGLLESNKGRYDYAIKDENGYVYRVIRFKMLEDSIND